MSDRVPSQVRRVVDVAQEEARRLDHSYIGTEHILLALISERSGTAARALALLGITEEAARQQVEHLLGRGHREPSAAIMMTPPAKRALELALTEAVTLGAATIGTEHILLGLIREGDGKNPACQALDALGAEPSRLRQQVLDLVAAQRGTKSWTC